jgi:hypothetical protein
LSNQLFTFIYQVLLVEVNQEVFIVANNFKVNNLGFLVFVYPHGKDKGTLGVSLTPLFGFWVVESESKDALSELVHNVNPEHLINLMVFEAKQAVDILQSAQVETTCVCSAFLVTCRDASEFGVPGVVFLVTALIGLICNWTSELVG